MNCREFQEWLHGELDGEASAPDAGRADHLAACADCRQLQAAAGRMQFALCRQTAPVVPPEFASRVVNAVLSDRRKRNRRRWMMAGAFALAASLFVAVWVNGMWDRSSDDQRAGSDDKPQIQNDVLGSLLAATQELSVRAIAAMPKAPEIESIQSTVSDATTVVSDMTSQTVGATVAKTKMLLPSIDGPLLPPMDDASPLEPATASLVETGQSVTAGLEPVANSAKRAFSMFRRDLPALPGL